MRGGLGRSFVLRSLRVPAGDSEGGGCETRVTLREGVGFRALRSSVVKRFL
jgi:hypothetical protein